MVSTLIIIATNYFLSLKLVSILWFSFVVFYVKIEILDRKMRLYCQLWLYACIWGIDFLFVIISGTRCIFWNGWDCIYVCVVRDGG